MGLGIVRIERDRTRQQQMRFLRRLRGIIHKPARTHAQIMGFEARRPLTWRRGAQSAEQGLDDPGRDLILGGEDIV
jgi:hypothetical protein